MERSVSQLILSISKTVTTIIQIILNCILQTSDSQTDSKQMHQFDLTYKKLSKIATAHYRFH